MTAASFTAPQMDSHGDEVAAITTHTAESARSSAVAGHHLDS
jgi:hypothetical protein